MATIHWRTGAGGDWSQGANWLGGVSPGAGDDAIVDVGIGTYTVTISTSISANSLSLSSGALVSES
jgi:hypothetical protein